MDIIWDQKPQKGGQGGGSPANALQDHFSNSSNSSIKIAEGGGGVRPMILAIIMCISTGFYNLATSIAFSHNLYVIDSIFFLAANSLGSHSMYAPSLHISSA